MAAEAWMVWLAAVVGLAVSVAIELFMSPRPPLLRPWAAWALHGGVWLVVFVALTMLLGRPWFAAAGISALLLIVVLVNNAKLRALREPFVFQDYEYFTDAIRHPRLYIPFLGWGRFLAAAAGGVVAIAVGLWIEPAPSDRWGLSEHFAALLTVGLLGGVLLLAGLRSRLPVTFDPTEDIQRLGFLAFLWRYAEEQRQGPSAVSPFDFLVLDREQETLPHLLAIQSESFFDPRPLFAGIRPEVLQEFDRIKREAVLHGRLQVPAWGANTVRSEFAFLTGIDQIRLGVHRFNPYRAVAAGWRVASLASLLRRLGYHTVCVHPYPSSFYRRDRVYPRLGFDEFLDVRAFTGAERFGPYVADTAVAEKVASLVQRASAPLFVFVITMENHGPLHLERVWPGDVDALYSAPPPNGCDDLTIYLRHLRNADRMLAMLHQALDECERPGSLCWFGDHVPIMPAVYQNLGEPKGDVEYVCWSSRNRISSPETPLAATELALRWLQEVGLTTQPAVASSPHARV